MPNPMRLVMVEFRLFAILVAMLPLVFRVIRGPATLALAPYAVSMYLDACQPLPPCKGKIRDWLRALKPLVPVPSEAAGH